MAKTDQKIPPGIEKLMVSSYISLLLLQIIQLYILHSISNKIKQGVQGDYKWFYLLHNNIVTNY